MRKTQFNRSIERSITTRLVAIAEKYGIRDAEHAMTKWCKTQSDLAKIDRERAALEKRLSEITKKR